MANSPYAKNTSQWTLAPSAVAKITAPTSQGECLAQSSHIISRNQQRGMLIGPHGHSQDRQRHRSAPHRHGPRLGGRRCWQPAPYRIGDARIPPIQPPDFRHEPMHTPKSKGHPPPLQHSRNQVTGDIPMFHMNPCTFSTPQMCRRLDTHSQVPT